MILSGVPSIERRSGRVLFGLLAGILLSFMAAPAPAAQTPTFYFIFHDPDWGFTNSVEALQRLTPFCDYLSSTLNKRIEPLFVKQGKDLESALSRPEVLFGLLNRNVMIQKEEPFGMRPILVPVRNTVTTHHKVFLTPSYLKINGISDLRGKRLAVLTSDKKQLKDLWSEAMPADSADPDQFFATIIEAVSSDSAISSLQLRLADCAVVSLSSFELAIKNNPDLKDQIRRLYLSLPISNSPLVLIQNRISAEESAKLESALLSLSESEKGRAVLQILYLEAFAKMVTQAAPDEPAVSVATQPETVAAEGTLAAQPNEASGTSVPNKAPTPGVRVLQIQWGDTLWSLAEKYLGSGHKYPILAADNQIANPDRILAGSRLKVIDKRKK